MSCPQIRCVHGEEDRSTRLRSPRGPCGGQTQNGDDSLCLLDGSRDEASLRETGIIVTLVKLVPTSH